jgi:hypothetical protein
MGRDRGEALTLVVSCDATSDTENLGTELSRFQPHVNRDAHSSIGALPLNAIDRYS